MASYFSANDRDFRPIRQDDAMIDGPAVEPPSGFFNAAHHTLAGGAGTAALEECMDYSSEPCPGPPTGFEWYPSRDAEEFLRCEAEEPLPDTDGYRARQRELDEAKMAKAASAPPEPAPPGPFHGSTLIELCKQYGEQPNRTSAAPCEVWADVIETLRMREEKNAWRLDPSAARHMQYRTTLIEWILEVCADFNFGPSTADLAVQYMDRVLSKVNVPKTSLQLVAMCCLEAAVKFEEVEQNVPSLPVLRKCASNVYSVEIIKKMELAVLIELDWELGMVVPAHFLEAVLAVTGGGTFPHDEVGDQPWTPSCKAQLRKLVCYLHSICLQDAKLASRLKPSQLAAAIIATARLQLKIYPVWPAELHVATGYSCDKLGSTMSKILQMYKESLPSGDAGCGGAGLAGSAGAQKGGGVVGSADTSTLDAVIQALDEQNRFGAKAHYTEGAREWMTPSPTGPLDSGLFSMMEG